MQNVLGQNIVMLHKKLYTFLTKAKAAAFATAFIVFIKQVRVLAFRVRE